MQSNQKPVLQTLCCFYTTYFAASVYFWLREKSIQKRIAIYKQTYPLVCFNLFISFPFFLTLVFQRVRVHALIKWSFVVKQVVWSIICFEISFYYIHRLLHVGLLYKCIHSIHHRLVKPVGFAALYCHPLEFLFANFLPATLGFITWNNTSLEAILIWNVLTALSVVQSHSITSHSMHLSHHAQYKEPFGFTGILDWIHST